MDGQPFGTATVWVRADLAADLSPRALERRPLSDQLGVELAGATETITAVSATKYEAELFQVPRGAPVLRVERTTSDTLGRIVLCSTALYNPLLTEFVAELPPALDANEHAGLRITTAKRQADRHPAAKLRKRRATRGAGASGR